MKKLPDFESAFPDEPRYDSWLWDGTKPKEHEQKKQHKPETKEQPKQPGHTAEKQEKKHAPEKELAKESQIERSKAKTPEQREEDRETIVEKSLQLKKHFENEPLPKDPHLVARLLVAEHILALNEQLEEKKPRKSEATPEELSIALDYMGNLAEKLENPAIEAAPDIEEAYGALIELTEEALQSATPEEIVEYSTKTIEAETQPTVSDQPELPVAPAPQAADSQPFTPLAKPVTSSSRPVTPAFIPPSPTAAILVTTLAALPVALINQQKQLTKTPEALPPPPPAPEAGGYYPAYTSTPEKALSATIRRSSAEFPTSQTAPERTAARPLPNLAPIAAIALAAAAVHKHPEKAPVSRTEAPAPRETASYVAEVSKTAKSIATAVPAAETAYASQETAPNYSSASETSPTHHTAPSHEVVAAYTKKLEHLPLHTLLTMAENVSLGYGRYLRQEFESNQIDKAGLIKVLKARAKGRDFSMEYRQQAARFRTIKSSPEFLRSGIGGEPAKNDSFERFAHSQEPAAAKPDTPEPYKPSKKVIDRIKSAASRITTQEDIPALPQQSQTPWIIAIIIALITLVAILIFMF